MTSTPLTASVTTTPPLSVGRFYTPAGATPGNVGVCLSGGGSRACSAGMGELRALAYLQANGASLLSQIKALSTVSGGSWLGVPYQFMPASGPSDAAYLGTYNADQGALTVDELASLPAGNAGNPMNSIVFSLEGIAGTAVLLYELFQDAATPLPANLLWQMVMALNLLDPYPPAVREQPGVRGERVRELADRAVGGGGERGAGDPVAEPDGAGQSVVRRRGEQPGQDHRLGW